MNQFFLFNLRIFWFFNNLIELKDWPDSPERISADRKKIGARLREIWQDSINLAVGLKTLTRPRKKLARPPRNIAGDSKKGTSASRTATLIKGSVAVYDLEVLKTMYIIYSYLHPILDAPARFD